MDRADEKKYTLDEYNWHIINNLPEFNDKYDLIHNLYLKMVQYLPEHPILSKFYELYETAFEYYDRHKSFPTIQWFEVNYTKTRQMKRNDDEFSINVYEDCNKQVDAEIIKKHCTHVIQQVTPDTTSLRNLENVISKYCDCADSIQPLTKAGLLNMYEEYAKDYKGVLTGIEVVDEQIGVLGHKSLSVFGAPSGHGKSTFAISVAYNAAVKQGLCVDYVSFEVPRDHIWFNLVSMVSHELGNKLVASEIKECRLTAPQRQTYKEVSDELTKRLNKSGGYINVIDQTTASVDTFESLKARLEGIATERLDGDRVYDRKADLIIIDNIDNFQILRSNERDEMVKVNNYIVSLDAYCKQYHHGDGCAILLLTQVNRGGLSRLQKASGEEDAKLGASKVDVTVFQRYNALYEKGTCCLVGYADAGMRMRNTMNIYPVKLRNRGVPEVPINVYADFAYSLIGGTDAPVVVKESNYEAYNKEDFVDDAFKEDFSDFNT